MKYKYSENHNKTFNHRVSNILLFMLFMSFANTLVMQHVFVRIYSIHIGQVYFLMALGDFNDRLLSSLI